jgi:hypothetical protein
MCAWDSRNTTVFGTADLAGMAAALNWTVGHVVTSGGFLSYRAELRLGVHELDSLGSLLARSNVAQLLQGHRQLAHPTGRIDSVVAGKRIGLQVAGRVLQES